MKKEIEKKLNWLWLVAEVKTEFEVENRIEEGHGYHSFIDKKELKSDVIKVTIKARDKKIDITDRLTQEELKLLISPNEIEENEL